MEPMEREDSSKYVSQQPETREVHEEPQPVTPAEPPKKKKGKAALILTLLLLLALAIAAAMGWLWYQQNGQIDELRSDLAVARNDVQRLESAAKAEANLDEPDSMTTDAADSESEAMIEAALTYEKAKVSSASAALEGALEKQSGDFARVAVSAPSQGPGAVVIYLKKVQSNWVVIGDSTDEFADLKSNFGITDAMLTAN